MANPRIRRTKIVATIGPACFESEKLSELVRAGVDVFRINTAHGSRSDHDEMLRLARAAGDDQHRSVAVLVDLAGPKIRLGQLCEEPLECQLGRELTFVRGEVASKPDQLVSGYERLIDELSTGNRIMLADGTVTLEVVDNDTEQVVCRVVSPGSIRSRQGINLPGVQLSLPTLSENDKSNALWAAQREVDFLGISFVRSADDVAELREHLRQHQVDAPWLIAKIEKPEALRDLDSVAAAADAVMIARGDLGVETDVADLAVVQKRIIAACNRMGRPVIVATQMLDSMQHSTQPTRAEATDVANAILDGTDACMLSGETAVGDYPLESVDMMRRIIQATEPMLPDRPADHARHPDERTSPIADAVVRGATRIATTLAARLVVVATRSGATALTQAKQRDLTPTVAVSDHARVLRRLNLAWGIIPVAKAPVDDTEALWSFIDRWGQKSGWLSPGDRVVLVAGTGFDDDAHNSVVVHEVRG